MSENRDRNADTPEGVRLQKVLSRAGVASRRATEDMIVEGRIQVDGEVVTELGRRVDPDRAVIHVDGRRVLVNDALVHLMLNKPKGILCTMSDDQGRPCIGDYLRQRQGKLFHVGRLDVDTEGLLLITNDGELAHRLTHPSYQVLKTYLAEVRGPIPKTFGRELMAGVRLDDGMVKVDRFRMVDAFGRDALVELMLHEGRKHIVRRLLAHMGHPAKRLVRTAIDEVRLNNERPGAIRPLDHKEVAALYHAVGL